MFEQVSQQPFSLILLLTFVGLGALSIGLFRRERWNKIRVVFGALVLSVCVWTLGDFLQAVTPRRLADIWALVRFLGICPVGALWFLLALLYTGSRWARFRSYVPFLLAPPVISYSLLLTNPWHHLFFTESLSIHVETEVFGPAYWFHTISSYIFIVIGIFLYTSSFLRTSERLYRKQTLIMILGCLIPFAGNVFFIFRIVSLDVDVTPLLLSVTMVLYGVGIYRLALTDLRPFAFDTILSNLRSGVLILNHTGRIVGTNPHFYELFDLRHDIVGIDTEELLDLIAPKVKDAPTFRAWIKGLFKEGHNTNHLSLELCTEERAMDLTFSPVFEDNRRLMGGILFLHDMTEWKHLHRSLEGDRHELARKNQELARMNEELVKKNEELERFNRFAVAREMKMIELKRRLKELEHPKSGRVG